MFSILQAWNKADGYRHRMGFFDPFIYSFTFIFITCQALFWSKIILESNNKCMKKDLLPVLAGDQEYCLSRLRRRYIAEKNRTYKGCFKGLVIGALAFLSFSLDRWWELIQEMMNT